MKRLASLGLTFALVALAAVPAAEAQERPTPRVATGNAATVLQRQANPFVLVNLARQGYFENFPSHGSLRQASVTDLVKAGIEQGRVAPEALNDPGYLHAVEIHLNTITNSR
ncbi:MAG: hypothetical protein ACFB4I_22970 [Cyanophyceae cyanobacterium]